MKLNYLKRGMFYVATAVAVTLVSCNPEETPVAPAEKGDINELAFDGSEVTTKYNQIITVSDESGKFSVDVNLGTNRENLLELALSETVFKLHLIYKDSKVEDLSSDKKNSLEGFVDLDQIDMTYTKLALDPEAVGFFLEVDRKPTHVDPNGRVAEYSYVYYYKSPEWWYHGRVVRTANSNTNSDVHVKWYYKKRWYNSWQGWNSYILSTTGASTGIVYDEYRIACKVSSNWLNYNVYWKKWPEDAWELDNDNLNGL